MVTVILTRESPDNHRIAAHLPPALQVVDYPCVGTRLRTPTEEDLRSWLEPRPAYLAVTSRRGVEALAPCAAFLAAARVPVAAVGDSTAAAVRRLWGVEPALIPPEPSGHALGAAFARTLPRGSRVLYLRGDLSTGGLAAALRDTGLDLDERVVYENVDPEPRPLVLAGPAVAAFASPSAVARFLRANPDAAGRVSAVAVGPSTAKALLAAGFHRVEQAEGTDPAATAARIVALTGGGDGLQPF
jgi:uroporphyrinogen-III synthase